MPAPPRNGSNAKPSVKRTSRSGAAVKLALVEPPRDGPLAELGSPPPAATDAEHAYLPGDIIAQKYRLTRLLGEGGMGTVWLARNRKLDVDVAIKLIRRELATPETARRLLQEARAAARLGHRSIVRIFDFGETELDDPFIVMEVLSGESLRDVLERKGRLPATNAVRTLLPIASALVEAHASGIVHRDLKPENVMLVPDKSGGVVPKLVDFGIAKLHRSEESRADDSHDEASNPNVVIGTPHYMSPEQAGGQDDVDESTDVWALAVMLYEAITGAVPFEGPNYSALIFAIMTAEPAPSHEQLAGDAELWGILQRGLAKQSGDRPRMRAFGAALAAWAIARGIESDVAGTSLPAHWGNVPTQSPFSVAPLSEAQPGASAPPHEIVIPRAGSMPMGLLGSLALTEAPPEMRAGPPEAEPPRTSSPARPSEARAPGHRAAWVVVAGLAAAAALVVALRGRAPSPLPALPATVAASAPADPGTAPLPTATSEPPATASAEPPVAPTASAKGRPGAGLKGRPWPRKPPRKGSLPIAPQPNF